MAGKGKNAGQSKKARAAAKHAAQTRTPEQVQAQALEQAPALQGEKADQKFLKKQAAGLRKRAKALQEQAEHEMGSFREGLLAKAEMLLDEAGKLDPKPVKQPKAPKEARPTCNQLKKDGTPCTSKAMAGHEFCTDHRPGFMHLKPEEFSAVAQWLDLAREGKGVIDQVAEVTRVFGWGQVRQAIKDGRIPTIKA